jgi:hypothetical protein
VAGGDRATHVYCGDRADYRQLPSNGLSAEANVLIFFVSVNLRISDRDIARDRFLRSYFNDDYS